MDLSEDIGADEEAPQGDAVGHALSSGILPANAAALYQVVYHLAPIRCLEIGMAGGVSSLSILRALEEKGVAGGRLTSLDPFQTQTWQNVGIEAVRRAGLHTRHELKQEFDYLALPDMLSRGEKLDFAYVDGWHTFDYTLLDFWYIDRMLRVGGVVAFNDCGFPAVSKVLGFVLTHRAYKELDVGLPISLSPSGLRCEDRYFLKCDSWEPAWNFFKNF